MIKEILFNKWFYSFLISWVVFLLLIDWGTFSKNIWGGIVAAGLELWQDATAPIVGMYYFKDTEGIALFNVPIFFTIGVAFTMGVIFLQYLPTNPKLQLLHLFAFISGFLIYEYIVTIYGMLILSHWSLIGSFFDDLIIFGSLVWLKQFILCRPKVK